METLHNNFNINISHFLQGEISLEIKIINIEEAHCTHMWHHWLVGEFSHLGHMTSFEFLVISIIEINFERLGKSYYLHRSIQICWDAVVNIFASQQ
jgi:hypothetical protein